MSERYKVDSDSWARKHGCSHLVYDSYTMVPLVKLSTLSQAETAVKVLSSSEQENSHE